MKKTLVALAVSAFAVSTANAAVIYNNEGTKVNVDGSVRLILEKNGDQHHVHSLLKDDGSRISFGAEHQLADGGFYALGRLEIRVKDNGTVYAKRAYAGIGSKNVGELTFGNQVTTADDLSIAQDYTYGILDQDAYIPTSANSAVRYAYKGIDNLNVGASYIFAGSRDDNNEVVDGTISNGFQVGATYQDGIIAKIGFGRTNYKTGMKQKHYRDGILASVGYEFGPFVVSLDTGFAKEKDYIQIDNNGTEYVPFNTKRFFVSPGFQLAIGQDASVYANYKLARKKSVFFNNYPIEAKQNGFLVGTDFALHKQVKVFVEGKVVTTKVSDPLGKLNDVIKDKAIGVGLRAFF